MRDTNLKLKSLIVGRYNTQSDFAERANLDLSLVNRIVNNRRKPTPEVRQKFARLLGVRIEEIFPQD